MKSLFSMVCFASISFATMAVPASANADSEDSVVVLDKSGKVLISYTVDELEKAFPVTEISTTTPWSNNVVIHYRGASVMDVLKQNQIENNSAFKAIAGDDYSSDIPASDITQFKPIIATHIGCSEDDYKTDVCKAGETYRPMTDADRGPFYMVWPQDKLPQTTDESGNHRWAWFLTGIQPI